MALRITIPELGGLSRSFELLGVDYSPQVAVTSHPVEQGAEVVDHAQTLPFAFTAQVYVTESPLGTPEPAAVEQAVTFLEQAQRRLLNVTVDGDGTWTSCLLTRWPHSKSAIAGRGFALAFQQVRIASALSVPIPPRKPAPVARTGAPTEQDLGTQAPTTGTPTSLLRQGSDAASALLRNFLGGG